jgi:hypothetical protein
MTREESNNQNPSLVPIDLEFIPEEIEVGFKEKLKLQIAFYRSMIICDVDNKYCKSSIMKYTVADRIKNTVKLVKENLSFCTTIAMNTERETFESKIVKIYKCR